MPCVYQIVDISDHILKLPETGRTQYGILVMGFSEIDPTPEQTEENWVWLSGILDSRKWC